MSFFLMALELKAAAALDALAAAALAGAALAAAALAALGVLAAAALDDLGVLAREGGKARLVVLQARSQELLELIQILL